MWIKVQLIKSKEKASYIQKILGITIFVPLCALLGAFFYPPWRDGLVASGSIYCIGGSLIAATAHLVQRQQKNGRKNDRKDAGK